MVSLDFVALVWCTGLEVRDIVHRVKKGPLRRGKRIKDPLDLVEGRPLREEWRAFYSVLRALGWAFFYTG
jgi:hypothetical protein